MIIAKKIEKFFSNSGTRNEVRERVITEFLQETPGTGSGDKQSKYLYYVETLSNGNRIYLERPVNLHNGFDFVINVENMIFLTEKGLEKHYPAHDHIIADLEDKRDESREKYAILYTLIEDVYNCKEIGDNINLKFDTGYDVDMILKVIKWFFIEQDIRYWNYSGRAMLMSGIPKT